MVQNISHATQGQARTQSLSRPPKLTAPENQVWIRIKTVGQLVLLTPGTRLVVGEWSASGKRWKCSDFASQYVSISDGMVNLESKKGSSAAIFKIKQICGSNLFERLTGINKRPVCIWKLEDAPSISSESSSNRHPESTPLLS